MAVVVVATAAFGLTCSVFAADRNATPASAVEGDATPDRTVVGFVTGHGEPRLDGQFSGVAEELRRAHTVIDVRLSEGASALSGVGVIIVAGGPDILDAELYELDQFLMRGGRVAFLLDGAVIPRTGVQANLSESNIFGFLSVYGIVVNPDLVIDRSCAGSATWGSVSTSFSYPYWPVVRAPDVTEAHAVLSGFTSVPLAWTSSIATQRVGAGGIKKSVLLRSSSDSWTVSAYADLDPEQSFGPPEEFDDVHRIANELGFPLAVAVEGVFESAFAGQKVIVQSGKSVEFVEPEGMIETSVPTRMVVFGGSMMFRDDLATQLPGNAELLASVVKWLATDDAGPKSAGGSAPAVEWTPRRLALVILTAACSAAAVAAAVGFALSRRRRPSSRT
ncbi:MAG: Gldg family protein [Candidatus Eisenbacteria sp.]|nr:Gldg family protein [Candidatus Eisenbacteria bacterium]